MILSTEWFRPFIPGGSSSSARLPRGRWGRTAIWICSSLCRTGLSQADRSSDLSQSDRVGHRQGCRGGDRKRRAGVRRESLTGPVSGASGRNGDLLCRWIDRFRAHLGGGWLAPGATWPWLARPCQRAVFTTPLFPHPTGGGEGPQIGLSSSQVDVPIHPRPGGADYRSSPKRPGSSRGRRGSRHLDKLCARGAPSCRWGTRRRGGVQAGPGLGRKGCSLGRFAY